MTRKCCPTVTVESAVDGPAAEFIRRQETVGVPVGGNLSVRLTRIRPLGRALTIAVLAVGLAASAVVPGQAGTERRPTGPPGGVPGVAVPKLTWTDCEDGFQCAKAAVPLDYRQPRGATIELALVRKPATDPARRIGSLFVNPGGPGGSAVDLARFFGVSLPEPLRARFDIVGFDPRGVVGSSPLHCLGEPEFREAFAASTFGPRPDAFERTRRLAKGFLAGCAAGTRQLLPYVGTANVARDMDVLRAAVGDETLTYLGISFGTYIGTVYANLFPQRVRALALDGAYDPHRYADAPYEYDHGQYLAVDGALDRFLTWCARNQALCRFGGTDPAAAFDRLLAGLDTDPVRDAAGKVVANGATVGYNVLYNLNGGLRRWPRLGDRLRQAEQRTGPLLVPITADDAAFMNANTVVECADRVFPRSSELLRYQLARHTKAAPRLGPLVAYGPPGYDHGHAPACSSWPFEQASRYAGSYRASGAAPILVVGTTGDPDTPYADSVALARTLERARLVTYRGEGHSAVTRSKCATDLEVAYLVDRVLPKAGAVCADEPPAEPVGVRGASPDSPLDGRP